MDQATFMGITALNIELFYSSVKCVKLFVFIDYSYVYVVTVNNNNNNNNVM